MLLGFLLFEAQFIHVVSITFTALVLNELLMVALTIRTWHGLMLLAELFSVIIYISSLAVLRDYFGESHTHTRSLSLSTNCKDHTWYIIKVIIMLISLPYMSFFCLYLINFSLSPVPLDGSFLMTVDFVWKTLVITAGSCIPLFIAKFMQRWCAPSSYTKLLKNNSMFRNCCRFTC